MSEESQKAVTRLAPQAPSFPGFSMQELYRMAESFAKSGLYGIKSADQAFALMMEAQAQHKHPALIMRDYSMIGTTLSKKTIAMVRDFQATGGRIEWLELSDSRAAANFTHPVNPHPVMIDWDLDRAKKAGLVKDGGMYAKYTRAMLRSRCTSEGIRTCAPDCTENMYTPDEVLAMDTPPVGGETINTAIEHAVGGLTEEQIEEYINAMDVTTQEKLEEAFAQAWRATKNPELRRRFQGCYDSMKDEIKSKEK